ncbi:trypsin-like serine protease [Flammeovirgaceae bacterium SG7u.111]|nr:trypsin-like serine protease [Flammeovirgaceae bacterium SG7u.132]WPO37125.1 trypsin-like serine protease [Flammeovirgaceae bacterium SG7u.111]
MKKITVVLFIQLLFVGSIWAQDQKDVNLGKNSSSDSIPWKIVGGKSTPIEEVPWQVFLREANSLSDFSAQFCGGTIIDEHWILTAAHCVADYQDNPTGLWVVAGESSLYKDAGQRMEVADIIIHPEYINEAHISNDIALIRLAKPLDLTGNKAQRIELATMADQQAGLLDAGKEVLVSGWGNQSSTTQDFADSLQAVTLPIVSNELANSADSYDGLIDHGMMAAGNYDHGGKDACQGDSGGPLAVRNADDSGWILGGVTSWGYGCGEAHLPGIYTRVPVYEQWIKDTTHLDEPTTPLEADLAINRLIALGSKGQPSFCEGKLTKGVLKMVVENKGLATANSVKVTISSPEGTENHLLYQQSISIENGLASGDASYIEITDFEFDHLGHFDLIVRIDFEGNTVDKDTSNNSATHGIDLIHGHTAKLDFHFDDRPNEVSWHVLEAASGEIVFTGNGGYNFGQNHANSLLGEEFCLPEGNYTLVVEDLFKNGLNHPDGYVELKLPVADSLFTAMHVQGNYGGKLEFPFSIPFVPNEKVEVGTFLDLLYTEKENVEFPLEIKNTGNATVQEIELAYSTNGHTTYAKTGISVRPLHKSSLSIDVSQLTHTENELKIWVTSLNGRKCSAKDTLTIFTHKPEKGINLTVKLFTDNYPEENAWRLLNAEGNVINGFAPHEDLLNDSISYQVSLPEGEYKFHLLDHFGDGSAAPIAALLSLSNGDSILSIKGDAFEYETAQTFMLINAPSDVVLENTSSTSTQVNWVNNSGLQPQFVVEARDENGFLVAQETVDPGKTEVEILGLTANESLSFSVRAMKNDFVSQPSESSYIVTSLEDELLHGEFVVYPNPASQSVNVSWEGMQPKHIGIYNLAGRLMASHQPSGFPTTSLDISTLPEGLYLLKTSFNNGEFISKKLVVKR